MVEVLPSGNSKKKSVPSSAGDSCLAVDLSTTITRIEKRFGAVIFGYAHMYDQIRSMLVMVLVSSVTSGAPTESGLDQAKLGSPSDQRNKSCFFADVFMLPLAPALGVGKRAGRKIQTVPHSERVYFTRRQTGLLMGVWLLSRAVNSSTSHALYVPCLPPLRFADLSVWTHCFEPNTCSQPLLRVAASAGCTARGKESTKLISRRPTRCGFILYHRYGALSNY